MSSRYTHKIFYMFQKEVISSMKYGSQLKYFSNVQVHVVKRLGDTMKFREVTYDSSNDVISCSCKMFESEGIPCAHIIVVLRNNFIDCLPENLILERWTTSAKWRTVYDNNGVELQETQNISCGRKNLQIVRGFAECLDDAPTEVCDAAKEMLCSLQELKLSHSTSGSSNSSQRSIPSVVNVHPPNISKTKGSGKRLKGGKEIVMEDMGKRRTCSVCGKKDKHNARTCPKLKEMLSQNETQHFNETQDL
ncbi:Protein FAR1-RELATED SEQUENCE 12 [Acorus calamus]|uniref:Protein FAR1-RELATED SEQUENCE 12 n=1 Tax=Acorus calamus TaxID=4465 RepID=A0AAV9DBK0_ACOCL|nr:Protein FAR1-RELATED SEQUENCE 12 [Acorus calamus]KAK1316253.1 Protein FAR1-RELATED SEQUENCE 12 [Acorus calamus]